MTAEGNSTAGRSQHRENKEGIQRIGVALAVKTKTQDGGSNTTPKGNDGSDTFSRYSNPSVRRRLLGLDDAEAPNEGAGAINNTAVRKTRLTTEVHDSVFYEEMMMMIDELQE